MKKLAIIGTGIAGMGAAYFLKDKYAITFYEKENEPGGHTNTLTVDENGTPVHIDSAFMVYNETTYPLLTRLFKELDVQTKPTSMSFSVQHVPSGLEFCGSGLSGLFAQRWNVLNPFYIRMLLEIQRFQKEAVEVLDEKFTDYSLARYVSLRGYSRDFVHKFLIPMSSAVWSMPVDHMLRFPAMTLVRFFHNHGFLRLSGQLQWRTCVNGSRQYRDKLLARVNARMLTGRPAVRVVREGGRVIVEDSSGQKETYDKAILACHSDDALNILQAPTALEQDLLRCFAYHDNEAVLHTDEAVMPKTRAAWSSWNYRIQLDDHGQTRTTTIYDMNSLQQVSQSRRYFISINDPGLVDPAKVLWRKVYRHPVYSVASQKSQAELHRLNLGGPVYFCGAYFRYGFHEDGLWAALNAARAIAGETVWA